MRMMPKISPRGDGRNYASGRDAGPTNANRRRFRILGEVWRTLVIRLLATIARLLIPRGYGHPEQGLRDVICCVRMVPIKPFELFSGDGNNCDDIENQLSNFFIFEAEVCNAFKREVDHIFEGPGTSNL
jgi:hypothetical protein